jgi:hypothetical protein
MKNKTQTSEGGEVIKTADNKLNYNMYHWGPLLFKTTLRQDDINALKGICSQPKEIWSENLAGIIEGEYKIDSATYTKIITPYLKAYQSAYKEWYGLVLNAVETTAAWVNFMKKGECNPPHIHHNCHLSSTLILDIPDKLKKEQKNWKGTGDGPGALSFFIGNPQNFHTNSLAFLGEVGDFFIFPWNLTHSVSSFTSDITRMSIAANFKISDNNIFEKKDGKEEA